MSSEERLSRIELLLESILADRIALDDYLLDSKMPLPMKIAAKVCHCQLRTIRELVVRKQIPAYRSDAHAMWRVFPKDIQAFLMAESNQAPARRMRVLRRA